MADWIETFGDGPLILHAGFGTGRGRGRASRAFDQAIADLEAHGGLGGDTAGALATIGMPLDGKIAEMEWLGTRFNERLRQQRALVSAPMVPFTPSLELVLLTGRPAPAAG